MNGFINKNFKIKGGITMKRRIISIFLVILIVLSMFPVTVSASDFSYVNENNEIKTAESCTAITQDSKNLSDGWYIVESDVTISSRLGISGTVNLIIADGATLTVSGISLNIGNTLKIYAQEQGTGELVSTSSADRAAGIGGDYGYSNLVGNSGGDLYVYGGNIVATGGVGGAGIGGGASKINVAMDGKDGLEGGDGGNVYIYGGTVTATGGAGASGIGGGAGNDGNANSSTKVGGAGGRGGNGGNVYIYGGTVTAIGGEGAADIGGGKGGNGGNGGNFTLDYSSGYTPPGNGGDGGNGGAGGSVTLSGSTAKINASIGGGNGGSGGEPGQETAGTVVSFVRPGSAGTAGQSSVLLIADSATTPEGIDENAMVIQLITDGNGTIQIAYDASSSTVSFTPKPNKGYAFDSYDSSSLTVENHQVSFVAGNHTLSAKFTKKPHSHDEIVYTKISQSMLDSGSFSSGYYYLDENLDASNMIKIPEGANVTICLNDEVLNMGQWNYFDVASGAALTICDCQENQGEITAGINAVVSKGTFTVSGGTLTANTPISNSGICTVEGTAVINGIHTVAEALNNSGELHLSGGSVTAKSGAVYSDGGKIYLSGKVILSGGDKDLNIVKNTEIYAHKLDDTNYFYIGDVLTISLPTDYLSEGNVVVKEVNDNNKKLFTLINSNGFVLSNVSGNLVLHKHIWSTEWTTDENAHWHECTADICDLTDYSKVSESGYEAHTPEADDGDCTTELICVVCQETLVEANKAHSFTNKASSQLVSPADCQNKAVYKLQCDNCNVVSDTLTVEVGDLGNHNWDTKWTNDENAHWHECLVEGCDEINDNDTHYSTGDNIATYLKKAKCDACQIEYGEVVPDKILPIGMITVGTNKWLSFLNSVTFGLFFNETQSVEILAEDNETGVSKVEYYITDSELSGDEVKAITNWNEYTGKFNIEPENKYVIYAKVTDNSGNVIYINTDGIVIDSIAPVVSGIENKKTYCQAVEVSVSDDNLKNVTVNGTEVTLTDGKLTVNPAENEQVIVAEDFAGNKTTYTIKVNDGHTLFYSAFNESIAEICEYCNHFAVAVIKMDKTTYTYNGNPVNAYIEYSGNEFLDGNNLTVYYTQLVDERYEVINSAPVNVGKYRACFDIGNKTAKLNFIIEKQEITAPAIESKVFTGSEQIADIAENSLYDVKVNNGGTNVGKYDVVLSLTDSENYKWETTDETEITVKFTISPKALKQSDFYIPVTEYKYTGSENRPDVVPAIGTFLYTGDFRTEYRNNINVGTAKIIITGVGNYSGVVEYSFEIVKAEQNAPTGFIVLDESYALDADGQINGVNTDMEYRKDGETQYIEINSNVLPNLTPGKYYIRYKEKSNYNPSEDTEIVINPGEKRTSSVEITAELDKTYDGNPASLENEYKYYGDGEISVKWYADVNGERGEEISAPVNAGTYWVGVNAAETDRYNPANGYKQFIISKAVKDPTEQNIQGIVNGYTEDKSGVISGVTPEMEYRKEGETAYTPVTGNEITDLENGTYYIRYAGDENHNPSDEIKIVIQAPDCDCKCHSENPFMQFINKVFYAICNFFGVNRHCCCDATHYDSYMWKPITDLFKK